MISKNNWEQRKLGDICEVKKGTPITKDKVTDGKYPVIAGGQNPAYYHNEFNRNEETITISASGAYAGFVNYFETKIFASDCTTISPMDTKKLLPKFVFHFLKSKQNEIYDLQQGAGQPHVYPKDLKKIILPVPPIEEQRKILLVLDKILTAKKWRKESNKLTAEFLENTFLSLFTNYITDEKLKKVKLKEIIENIDSGESPICESIPRESEDQKAILKLSAVTYGHFDPNENKKLPNSTILKREVTVEKNDLLFSRKNTLDFVGATVFCFEDYKNLFLSDTIFKLNYDKDKVNGIFLWKLLSEKRIRNDMKKLATGSAGSMPNISKNRLLEFSIPLPPLSLQEKFANIVIKVRNAEEQQQKSGKNIENLFDSLTKIAFKGELSC